MRLMLVPGRHHKHDPAGNEKRTRDHRGGNPEFPGHFRISVGGSTGGILPGKVMYFLTVLRRLATALLFFHPFLKRVQAAHQHRVQIRCQKLRRLD